MSMHMKKVRPKTKHSGRNLKHVRIEFAKGGNGASVYAQSHGDDNNPYPPEIHSGSFTTKREAFDHAQELGGVDAGQEGEAGAAEEAALVPRAKTKGKEA